MQRASPGPAFATHVVAVVLTNAVPIVGIVFLGWTASTVLALLWLETVLLALANLVRIVLHRRWTRTAGHWNTVVGGSTSPRRRRAGGSANGKTAPARNRASGDANGYAIGYVKTVLLFTGAHGLFLGAILTGAFINELGGDRERWRLDPSELAIGAGLLALVIVAELVIDLFGLSRRTFYWLERRVESSLGRVMALHLGLILGVMLLSRLESPIVLLVVFLALKACLELLGGTGDEMPERPPSWFLRVTRAAGRDGEAEYRKLVERARLREAVWTVPVDQSQAE